jgi:hypothetical protein
MSVDTIQPNQSLVAAKIDNEMVLLDLETGVYFGLDEIGTRIWDLVCAGESVDEIVDHLGEEYDAEPGVLRADLIELLGAMQTKGLIEWSDN